jgi:hypothetical protein
MKEQNILAGFSTDDAAVRAKKALQEAGFSIIQIDHVGQFPGNGVDTILNPITGDIPSLASLTMAGDFPSGRDASVLAAADPDASGMSDRGDDIMTPFLLTAVVPAERNAEATEIIRSFGGMV